MNKVLFYIFLTAILVTEALSQNSSDDLEKRIVTENMQVPWEIRWLDNYLWVTGIEGAIYKINPDNGERKTILATVPDIIRYNENEPGMHGFDITHIDNKTTLFIAYTYLKNDNSLALRLIRYTYSPETDSLIDPKTIIENIPTGYAHSGCRVKVMADSTLFMTVGDGAFEPILSQDISSLTGKTLRIKLDGGIPNDNPFPNSYVWTWGHRNHQGLCITPKGIVYSTEHGTQSNDELNILNKGRNYGWPYVEGFCDDPAELQFCKDSNVKEPQRSFTPTPAVAGIEYLNNPNFPAWQNSLVMVSLKPPYFFVFSLNETQDSIKEQKTFSIEQSRLRSICITPQGKIFVGKSQGDHYGSRDKKDNAILEIRAKAVSIKENEDPNKPISIETVSQHSVNIKKSQCSSSMDITVYSLLGEKVPFTEISNQCETEINFCNTHSSIVFVCIKLNNTTIYFHKVQTIY